MRQLTAPNDKVLGKHIRQDTGSISITAEADGRHEYCFSNQMSAIADKIVRYAIYHCVSFSSRHSSGLRSFNVHGVIYVDEDGETKLLFYNSCI
jgi:hypothetical protein